MIDATLHKNICACGYTENSEHTYGNWSAHNDTQHKKACACGHTLYEDHAISMWFNQGDTHKGTCSTCAQNVTTQHNWNNGEITTEPTVEATGKKTFTCTDCAATKVETVDKLSADEAPPASGCNTIFGCKSIIGTSAVVAVLLIIGMAIVIKVKIA